MRETLLFTHIPKTAGTSVKKSVLFPYADPDKTYLMLGFRKLLADRPDDLDLLIGHFPYGIHRVLGLFSRRPYRYLTFLRDPLDQAVSYYHYVLQCETYNHGHPTGYGHPDLADAKRYPIEEFYGIESHRNMQAKFTAGLTWYRGRTALPSGLRDVLLPEGRLLARAQHNLLHNYWFFGLFERLDESLDRYAAAAGVTNLHIKDQTKVTRKRPRVDELTEAQRARILEHNHLDVALYDFAVQHFDRQAL